MTRKVLAPSLVRSQLALDGSPAHDEYLKAITNNFYAMSRVSIAIIMNVTSRSQRFLWKTFQFFFFFFFYTALANAKHSTVNSTMYYRFDLIVDVNSICEIGACLTVILRIFRIQSTIFQLFMSVSNTLEWWKSISTMLWLPNHRSHMNDNRKRDLKENDRGMHMMNWFMTLATNTYSIVCKQIVSFESKSKRRRKKEHQSHSIIGGWI